MRYRNRVLFLVAALGAAAQPVLLAWLLLVDEAGADEPVDLVALASLASLTAWFFLRVGVQPEIVVEGDTVMVRNPFVSYRADLSQVRFLARGGAFALDLEGIGLVQPWVFSRSVFDGHRARSARREFRERIQEAWVDPDRGPAKEAARRSLLMGPADALLLLPPAFLVWNVFDLLSGP
ncbi:hypothetical protein ACFVAM_23990 [Streptomyces californicus]|uniref:hypothetical protein n=1 Tax=Streptomyces californicus TaxID=67351 RepID=UPI0036B04F0A